MAMSATRAAVWASPFCWTAPGVLHTLPGQRGSLDWTSRMATTPYTAPTTSTTAPSPTTAPLTGRIHERVAAGAGVTEVVGIGPGEGGAGGTMTVADGTLTAGSDAGAGISTTLESPAGPTST